MSHETTVARFASNDAEPPRRGPDETWLGRPLCTEDGELTLASAGFTVLLQQFHGTTRLAVS